ncbi:MAG: acyltransferase family protein [Pseudomonadota bacterium]
MVTVSVENSRRGWRPWLVDAIFGHPEQRHSHLDALDGLRGLALIITICSHLGNGGFMTPALKGSGKPGLFLFFVLSAFLLGDALLHRGLGGLMNVRIWGNFAWRRSLRIWPLYLFLLGLSWALTMAGVTSWHYQVDTGTFWRHVALMEGQSVFWSIPVEFKFYFWLPLVVIMLAWMLPRRWPLWAEVAVFVVVLGSLYVAWPQQAAPTNSIQLRWYVNIFLLGAIAAYVKHRYGELLAAAPRLWAAAGILGLLGWLLTIPSVWAAVTGRPFQIDVNHRWFTYFGVCWALVLLAVLYGPRWFSAPFAWKPMRYLGVISFSAYLWHMPVLEYLRAAGIIGGLGDLMIAITGILAVATVSFLLIEYPCRGLYLAPRAKLKPELAGQAAEGP